MDNKFVEYDRVVSIIIQNILVERARCGKFLLYDFNKSQTEDKLYYNIMTLISDLEKELIYIDMPLFQYIKFKLRRIKTRKNLRWFGPIQKMKLSNENKTSVYIIMDFIREQLNLSDTFFEEINKEYYGGLINVTTN